MWRYVLCYALWAVFYRLLLASSLGWFSNPSRLFSRRRPWKGSLSYNKTNQCCYTVTQSLLPLFYITIRPQTRIGSIFVTQCAHCFIFLGRSWESERCCANVHDLPWHRHASPHAPNHTRYGSASVYDVSELSGPRTENQPQRPLQSMCRSQDHAAEEDFGGPHRQRWEWRDILSECDCLKVDQQTKYCTYLTWSCNRHRNERWTEDRVPWRGRPGARNRARWYHHCLGSAGTSTFHQVIRSLQSSLLSVWWQMKSWYRSFLITRLCCW